MKYIVLFLKTGGLPGVILWAIGTISGYYFLFSNKQLFIRILSEKSYASALFSMLIVYLAAALYGKVVSIISHQTIEKALGISDPNKGRR